MSSQEQRYQVHSLLKMGHKQTGIAEFLGVQRSTISRELRRSMGQRGYRPRHAHQKAMRGKNHVRTRLVPETWALVSSAF
jgi:IS30 family transposase